jgi:hypothetical protein
MLNAFIIVAVIFVVAVLGYNAYLLWYAGSDRYTVDRRLDSVTKN